MWIIIGVGFALVCLVGTIFILISVGCAKIDKVQDDITKY